MKKDFKFIDKSGTVFYVQAEIKEKDGEKCFSMSASYNGGGGQCYDSIQPADKYQKRLVEIWKEYHLNYMKASTQLPENFETELEGLINNLDRDDLEADATTQFLKDTETTITKKYVKNGPYFEGETEYRDIYRITLSRNGENYSFNFGQSIANQGKEPTNYDILACLEKYDYGSFEDFCNELGYDPYSKKSKKAYKACEDQHQKLAYMFGQDEMDKLREIQ